MLYLGIYLLATVITMGFDKSVGLGVAVVGGLFIGIAYHYGLIVF